LFGSIASVPVPAAAPPFPTIKRMDGDDSFDEQASRTSFLDSSSFFSHSSYAGWLRESFG